MLYADGDWQEVEGVKDRIDQRLLSRTQRNEPNTRFSNIFLSRHLPRCRKRH